MNRYVLSAIGAMICTTVEALLIHAAQLFFPEVYHGAAETIMAILPIKISSSAISLWYIVIISFLVWVIGFYTVLKTETEHI